MAEAYGSSAYSTLLYPGWKLVLKAEAKPGRTGEEEGSPPPAWRGDTEATEAAVAPGSPMKDDNTGLPAPDPPNPGKAEWPVNMEGALVRPRPKGEPPAGPPPGARPGYMGFWDWLDMEGAMEDMLEGRDEGGRDEAMEKGERPG